MNELRGDIRLWTDGTSAHAQIVTVTAAGPVRLQASAPLAVVRDQVMRALAAHGMRFEAVDPDVETIVGFFGRRAALKRLRNRVHNLARKASPAHHLVKRLAANPGFQRLVKQALPAGMMAAQFVPGMGPAAVAARMALQRLQSRGVPVEVPGLSGLDTTEGEVIGMGLAELIEGATPPAGAAVAAPKVNAAKALLQAAPSSPRARAKVKKIVSLAKAGDPRAKSAYRALTVAKAVSRAEQKPAPRRAPPEAVRAVRSASARTVPAPGRVPPRAPAAPPPARAPVPRRRGFDLFHYWRRGVE